MPDTPPVEPSPGDETLAGLGASSGPKNSQPTVVQTGPVQADPGPADHVQADPVNPAGALVSGRYEVESMLGEGGMGIVYRARHVLMRKTVALKVLHPEMTENPEVVARFQREAQAAANINHPNVCAATDFGQTDEGAFFLVMEFLEGRTLQKTIETYGRLSPLRAVRIASQICSALGLAHEMGVIHRDLKPENIMLVERDGDMDFVKIMDFGIARVRMEPGDEGSQTPARLTRAGMVYGTPHYMSPEQVVGGEIDRRADLYAVGVVLFEMLTGRLPFESDNVVQLMGMHVTQPAPAVSEVNDEVKIPRALEELVARLMSKAPEQRPQSASEVRERLEAIAQELDPAAAPRPPAPQTLVVAALEPVARQAADLGSRLRGLSLPVKAALAGSLAAVFFVAALAVVIASFSSSDPDRVVEKATASLASERESLERREDVAGALAKIRGGDLDALATLTAEHPANPHVHYLAALALMEAGEHVRALDHLDEAVEREGRYANERSVGEAVMAAFESRVASDQDAARAYLLKHPTHQTTARLEELAREGSTRVMRRRALAALRDSHQFEALEPWSKMAIELRNASGCNEHRTHVLALAELGDPRALGTLRVIDGMPRTGCGLLKMNDCYSCLRSDVRDAIDALEKKERRDARK